MIEKYEIKDQKLKRFINETCQKLGNEFVSSMNDYLELLPDLSDDQLQFFSDTIVIHAFSGMLSGRIGSLNPIEKDLFLIECLGIIRDLVKENIEDEEDE